MFPVDTFCMFTVLVLRDVRKLDKVLQLFSSAGMPQPSECHRFNLPNSFPCNAEVLPHLFQGMIALLADTEPHP